MNSDKSNAALNLFVLLALCLYSPLAVSDPASFSVLAPAPGTGQYGEQQSALISELKFRAVVEYLKGRLGARYQNLEQLVTPEFAEKYIMDYKVGRSATDRNQLELSGHLDADSLKRWVRLTEMKTRGGTVVHSAFLFTSSFSGSSLGAAEPAQRLMAQALLNGASSQLQKFNVRLTAPNGARPSFNHPVRSESELKGFSNAYSSAGYNTALWFHLSPCKPCGGSRLDTYFYNLLQNRILFSHSDSLPLEEKDLANSEKVRHVLQSPMKQFHTDFEALSSSGELFSNIYHIQIEGIETYRAYKAIDNELSHLDSLSRSQLVRAEYDKKLAEFEVTSQLGMGELKEALKQTDFARANLRITVR